MSRYHLGRCEIPSLPHGYAIRGAYGPLRIAMAQDDVNRVRAPPPLISSAGGVRLYSKTSTWEDTVPR